MPQNDHQKQAEAARRAMSKAARELDDDDAIKAGEFLQVLKECINVARTPVEDFIVGLPHRWSFGIESGWPLTPDEIIDLINVSCDGMRDWFDDAVEITKLFNSRYRRVIEQSTAQANTDGGEA